MDNTKITCIEWCAGYAGIGIGVKAVLPNLVTIAFSEIEAYAVANLVSKMESGLLDAAPIWTDIKTFPSRNFYKIVDLLVAGYPCQPFSAAGKRGGRGMSDTYGHISQTGLDLCVHKSVSLKTSKGMSRWDSPLSLVIWKNWVIRCRGDYSRRRNAVRHTNANGYSFSLPTPTAMEWKDVGEVGLLSKIDKGGRVARRLATMNLQVLIGRVKVSTRLLELMMGVPIGWTACDYSATE